MKLIHSLVGLLATAVVASAHAGYVDTAQYGKGYFVDTDANKYNNTYWRGQNQDWSWAHEAITTSFSTASLSISAFDVDAPGEVDKIYAYDSGTWNLLGSLAGSDNTWAFSTFNLGANYFDDIATGLQVKIDIDSNNQGWLVTLAKSSLSVDGAALPPPIPAVPEPETYAMLLAGLGVIGAMARRRKQK